MLTITNWGVAPAGGPGAGGLAAALGAPANLGRNGEADLSAFGDFTVALA
ncbi:MAG: hypothetical protein JWM76_1528 [Pseudonocardiales bacterium]|nr:hypothetical protein [Pseudonocardiales bacterium]